MDFRDVKKKTVKKQFTSAYYDYLCGHCYR